MLPNSCFSTCNVLTFCDEIAWKVISLVTYICRTFFIVMLINLNNVSNVWRTYINIVLFYDSILTKWTIAANFEPGTGTSMKKEYSIVILRIEKDPFPKDIFYQFSPFLHENKEKSELKFTSFSSKQGYFQKCYTLFTWKQGDIW